MRKKSGASSAYRRPQLDWHLGGSRFGLGRQTKIMGVLNVTPDSFSDGGFFLDPGLAQNQALRMQEAGAHLIDVGGESSRPGSRPVSAREEIKRIKPVLKRLSRTLQIPISIDTYKYDVAHAALDEGAVLVNDIHALKGNKRLARLIARYKAGVVLMHMQGAPLTMQENPYYRNLIKEVRDYLRKAVYFALEAGIAKSRIAVDPGFGFGKTGEQNFEVLSRLHELSSLKCPVLVGLSRKSFIGNLLGISVGDRLYGSLAAAAAAIHQGAHVLRVHDVLPHKHVSALIDRTLWN